MSTQQTGELQSFVTATVTKDAEESTVGTTLSRAGFGKEFVLKNMAADGPFQGTDLKEGHEITSINNVQTEGKHLQAVVDAVREAEGPVTMLAKFHLKEKLANKEEKEKAASTEEATLDIETGVSPPRSAARAREMVALWMNNSPWNRQSV